MPFIDDSLEFKAKNTRKSIEELDMVDSSSEAKEELKRIIEKEKISLFLGTGVSLGCGIPNWENLIASIFKHPKCFNIETKTFQKDFNKTIKDLKFDSLQSVQLAQRQIEKKDGDLIEILKEQLYEQKDKGKNFLYDPTKPSPLDWIIENLWENHLTSVITYNFDNLLETKLTNCSKDFNTVYDLDTFQNRIANIKSIYHVHGYISNANSTKSVIFSEDRYIQQYHEPLNWNNLIQLNQLINNTCLFMGVSLTDPNMRRLLIAAKQIGNKTHYAIKEKYKNDYTDRIYQDYLRDLGIKVLSVDSFLSNEQEELIKYVSKK